MPLRHCREHRIAAFSLLHQHRRNDGNGKSREHSAAIVVPAAIPRIVIDTGRIQRRAIPANDAFFGAATILGSQACTQELCDIVQWAAERDALPIDDGNLRRLRALIDQKIVEPIVDMDQRKRRLQRLKGRVT